MENEELSGVLNKFSDILKEKDINLNDYIDESIKSDNSNSCENNNDNSNNNTSNNNINFDINTLLKVKSIADKLTNTNNPRSSLLLSLKPFLSPEKQEKIDEYVKIINIIDILEVLKNDIL